MKRDMTRQRITQITPDQAFQSLLEGLLPAPPPAPPQQPQVLERPLQVLESQLEPPEARAEVRTTEVRASEWIALGYQVHGGWGSFLTLGIRIGMEATRRFEATRRTLDVTYLHSMPSPRACVADGLLLSTFATPGQNTLRIVPHRGAPGTFGEAIVRHVPTGRSVRYLLPHSALALLNGANELQEREGFDLIMNTPQEALFWIVPGRE